jgi:hypothetical protein
MLAHLGASERKACLLVTAGSSCVIMKRSTVNNENLAKRLIPLGAVAIAAGCGGGHAALPTQNEQSTPNQTGRGTATAMITIAIPARGAKSVKRAPKYISQGSAAIGVSIAAAGSSPAPAETVFPLPSPAPVATTTTLPVTAPVGTDTVTVHVYDAVPSPGASATPNVLSEGATTATVTTGQSSPIAVTALGVAAGVQLSGSSNSTSFEVLRNYRNAAQSVTLSATPVDADGYAITGTLANPPTLTVPAGVIANPATITAATTALTLTLPASTLTAGGKVSAGLQQDAAAGSTDNFQIAAMSHLFITSQNTSSPNNTVVSIIDPQTRSEVASISTPYSYLYAGATAIADTPGGDAFEAYTTNTTTSASASISVAMGLPGSAAPTAVTDTTDVIAPPANSYDSETSLAADSSGDLYSSTDPTLTRYVGFPDPVSVGAVSQTGWTANGSLSVAGDAFASATLYGTYANPSTSELDAESLPLSGGTATMIGEISSDAQSFDMYVGGQHVYALTFDCSGDSAVCNIVSLPDLTTTTMPADFNDNCLSVSQVGVAPNGTVYYINASLESQAAKRKVAAFVRAHPAKHLQRSFSAVRRAASGTPPPFVSMTGSALAVSPDGQFLAVVTDNAAPATLQLYAIPTSPGATPVALGTPVPLPDVQGSLDYVVFPH